MDAITLGPLMLPFSRLPGIFALLALVVTSEVLDKKYPGIARWGWLTALIAAVGGRLGFAAMTPSAYWSEPWTLVYFWQPGYSWWAALLAALIFSGFYWSRHQQLRKQGAVILASAAALGLGTLLLLPNTGTGEQLPGLQVFSLEGEEIQLTDFKGEPLVVNLWATWCPPCRREMPMLESYEEDDRLQVVLINQGESLLAVQEYLQEDGLEFAALFLDPAQEAMQLYQAPGLPATLFYNEAGELVDRHFGELSRGQIEQFIRRHGRTSD
ncbi:Thiol-disulfide isomerase or thioredoxin [Marinospirillum celere]|uniref:Thiol-disulfide isomerase or thioredoxin n=1 Tax=Marinospirillum celere TaxID=1122252 RepID=A0A1I1HSC3_9GAMM|nr:TlpA disulfide reductase family protein [Marinospirillum celere]SFC26786.1 Thiol-disulfide isomerase or thioredoxin [Marinospirillum celere]